MPLRLWQTTLIPPVFHGEKYEGRLKSYKPHPEGVGETSFFLLIFQYIPVNINGHGPKMLMHCNPIMEEGSSSILVLQKLFHSVFT